MADAQQSKGHGFMATVTKRALSPIVSAAATAVTAYLMRKAAEVWEAKLQPKIEETAGEQPDTRAAELGDEGVDSDREQQRRLREQRRQQRRKALEQTGSS